MGLKVVIDKLEDVEESLRGHYQEKDGKFHLQIEGGVKTQADIDRQLAANQKERNEHKATKDKLTAAEAKVAAFGELDPADVQSKLEKLTQLEAAGPNAKADEIRRAVEEGVTNRMKVEGQKATRVIEALNTQVATLTATNTDLIGKSQGRTIDDAVREAAIVAKVIPEALGDVLVLARQTFKLAEDGAVIDTTGRNPTQWLEDSKKNRAYLWPVAKGTGAQGGGDDSNLAKDNPFSAAGWNLTKQGAIARDNPAKADELAKLAGTRVGGTRPPAPVLKAA